MIRINIKYYYINPYDLKTIIQLIPKPKERTIRPMQNTYPVPLGGNNFTRKFGAGKVSQTV